MCDPILFGSHGIVAFLGRSPGARSINAGIDNRTFDFFSRFLNSNMTIPLMQHNLSSTVLSHLGLVLEFCPPLRALVHLLVLKERRQRWGHSAYLKNAVEFGGEHHISFRLQLARHERFLPGRLALHEVDKRLVG